MLRLVSIVKELLRSSGGDLLSARVRPGTTGNGIYDSARPDERTMSDAEAGGHSGGSEWGEE